MLGTNLSHYRIVEQIGAGGMGVVFLAHDEQLERDVAIKVLPSGTLGDEAARKRFRKEALSLASSTTPILRRSTILTAPAKPIFWSPSTLKESDS